MQISATQIIMKITGRWFGTGTVKLSNSVIGYQVRQAQRKTFDEAARSITTISTFCIKTSHNRILIEF
jgi:hypothetical protein